MPTLFPKSCISAVIVLCATTAIAQQEPRWLLPIHFGDSRDAVLARLGEARPAEPFDSPDTKDFDYLSEVIGVFLYNDRVIGITAYCARSGDVKAK